MAWKHLHVVWEFQQSGQGTPHRLGVGGWKVDSPDRAGKERIPRDQRPGWLMQKSQRAGAVPGQVEHPPIGSQGAGIIFLEQLTGRRRGLRRTQELREVQHRLGVPILLKDVGGDRKTAEFREHLVDAPDVIVMAMRQDDACGAYTMAFDGLDQGGRGLGPRGGRGAGVWVGAGGLEPGPVACDRAAEGDVFRQ